MNLILKRHKLSIAFETAQQRNKNLKSHWLEFDFDKTYTNDRHMSVIPFPVCEYAANHCREGRRLGNISNYIEGRRLKNKIK